VKSIVNSTDGCFVLNSILQALIDPYFDP